MGGCKKVADVSNFGHSVGEYKFVAICICFEYMLLLGFEAYISVEYICWHWIYHVKSWGDECKLDSFCTPFGRRVGEYMYIFQIICLYWIYATNNFWSICKLNI